MPIPTDHIAAPVRDEPAFPVSTVDGYTQYGMTLRDYFAGQALAGLLGNPGGPIQPNGMNGWGFCNCNADNVAKLAHVMADALLAARGTGESQ